MITETTLVRNQAFGEEHKEIKEIAGLLDLLSYSSPGRDVDIFS